MSLMIDTKIFENSIKNYEKKFSSAIKDSLYDVGLRIVVDAVTKPPKAPILDGFLTGSFWVAVTNREIMKPENFPSPGDVGKNTKRKLHDASLVDPDVSDMTKYELRVGNAMIYARRLHENPFIPGEWSEKRGGVGYKFLSSKLSMYRNEYLRLLAGFIKKRMK